MRALPIVLLLSASTLAYGLSVSTVTKVKLASTVPGAPSAPVAAPQEPASPPAAPPAPGGPAPAMPAPAAPGTAAPTPLVPAYTVPFRGWSAQDRSTWAADSGVCLIREEKHAQDFPAFATSEEAAKFGARLQKSLFTQKMQMVYTQPVERSGKWGVLASYKYTAGSETFRVSQLYLSEGGKLRTFTGSSREGVLDPCVNDMLSFVRYLAN